VTASELEEFTAQSGDIGKNCKEISEEARPASHSARSVTIATIARGVATVLSAV
jgi:hypothetical protein